MKEKGWEKQKRLLTSDDERSYTRTAAYIALSTGLHSNKLDLVQFSPYDSSLNSSVSMIRCFFFLSPEAVS